MGEWWPRAFSWSQDGLEEDRASEVEVRFTGSPGGGTHVALEHHGWERPGEAAQEYRDGFASAGA